MLESYKRIILVLWIVGGLILCLMNYWSDLTTVRTDKRRYNQSRQDTCSPMEHILFLKTHKTGSSTMANIFFRYGDSRNLSFVLGEGTFLGWPERFFVSHALPLYGQRPNILSSHAKFNKKPMNWLFPKESSKYITILRNPVDNFESAFNYMHFGRALGIKDNLDALQVFLSKKKLGENTLRLPLVRNPMLYDLGLGLKFFQNLSAVQAYIQFLDKEFDLVMIMDYFDESLVLMKRLLCWKMDDILYLKLNERQDNEKAMNLSEETKENIRRWNQADVLLFNHFNRTFWKKIEMEGQSFYEELTMFRRMKDKMKSVCVTNETHHLQTVFAGKVVKGYAVRANLTQNLKRYCESVERTEINYLERLRKKRHEKFVRNEMEAYDKKEKNMDDWNVAKDLDYHSVQSSVLLS